MPIILYRNQKIELDGHPVEMNFRWTAKENAFVDISLSAFMTDSLGQMPSKDFFVFFGNTESLDSSVVRADKSLEKKDALKVQPSVIAQEISQIHIVATLRNGKDFSQIKNAIFEINSPSESIASHFFYGTFISETAIELGTFFKENNKWYFLFSGRRYQNDLLFFLIKYSSRTLI